MTQYQRINVRLPDDLFAQIVQKAQDEDRSLNKIVERTLRMALDPEAPILGKTAVEPRFKRQR